MAQANNQQDRSILITGCSSGIGECVAYGLHERGYRVFASVRNPKDRATFLAAGMECLVLDYCDSESIKAAVEQLLEKTDGRLYALFNNGAYGNRVPARTSAVRRYAGNSKPTYSAGWSLPTAWSR